MMSQRFCKDCNFVRVEVSPHPNIPNEIDTHYSCDHQINVKLPPELLQEDHLRYKQYYYS